MNHFLNQPDNTAQTLCASGKIQDLSTRLACIIQGIFRHILGMLVCTTLIFAGPANAKQAGGLVAHPINITISQNSPTIYFNGDVTGSYQNLSLASRPAHGSASVNSDGMFSYKPNLGFIGNDSFQYQASDGNGLTSRARITITVVGPPPTAQDSNASVIANTSANIISTITSKATKINLLSAPAHGVATVSGLNIVYAPSANYVGTDTITYTAENFSGISDPATITITVTPVPQTIPSARPVSASVQANSSDNSISSSVSSNATSISVASAPAHGTATVNGMAITYTPTANFAGSDSFTYTASNAAGTSAPATVSVTITGTVDTAVPGANALSATVQANSQSNVISASVTGTVSGIALNSSPAHGTASVNGMNISYTPTTNYVGTDSFSYTAINRNGNSIPATISITVSTTPPNAASGNLSLVSGTTGSLDLGALVSATVSTGLSISISGNPGHGTYTLTGTRLTYTPNANYVGSDKISFIATTAGGASKPADVNITVTARPKPDQSQSVGAIQAVTAAVVRHFETTQFDNFNGRITELMSNSGASRGPKDTKDGKDNKDSKDQTANADSNSGKNSCGGVGMWAAGVNSFGSFGGDTNMKFRNGGASFGGDRCFGKDTIIGVGFGYGSERSEARPDGNLINAQARTLANYGNTPITPFLNFSWVVGVNDMDSNYDRAIPDTSLLAQGKWSGKQWMGSTSVSSEVSLGSLKLIPFLRVDKTKIAIAAYSESNALQYALHYAEQKLGSQRASFGFAADTSFTTPWGEFTPRMRLEYQHDAGSRDDLMVSYVDTPDGPGFVIPASKLDRNMMVGALGADWVMNNGLMLVFNYGYAKASEGTKSNSFRLRLTYKFN
jgi:hypothetical protein